MHIYLTQHGQAVSKDIDPDRPLSEAGRDDVHRLTGLLRRRSWQGKRWFV